MQSLLDFIIKLNVDAREGLGEDSWCYAFDRHTGMIAAFDGSAGGTRYTVEYAMRRGLSIVDLPILAD